MAGLKPERVAVVGSGIMGAGIAALFANEGIPVVLFDVDEGVARKNLGKLVSETKLPQLTVPERGELITPAATARYAELLPGCDVIVEVVPEVLSLKQRVFREVDAHRRPGSLVATNTSGLSVAALAAGCSDDLRAHFLGTHFFYPVRYMPLVELIPGPDTRPAVVESWAGFFRRIGKSPLVGRDTPNFIANRVGIYSLLKALALTERHGLSFELVDQITGPPLAAPKSGTYRLADMVGLDTLLHASANSYENCPQDECREEQRPPQLVKRLVEAGRLGQKTGTGFYKREGGDFLVLDATSLDYRQQESPRPDLAKLVKVERDPAARLRAVLALQDSVGAFARELVLATGAYALNRVGEVADDVKAVDDAMRLGFGRELGPIQALDALGLEQAADGMRRLGIPVPALLTQALAGPGKFYGEDELGRVTWFDPARPDGRGVEADDPRVLSLPRLRRRTPPLAENDGARLLDLGDGVLLCEPAMRLLPDLNPIDAPLLELLERAEEELTAGRFRALVIGNQAANFSAGANLKAVLALAEAGDWARIEALVKRLQERTLRHLHAAWPVVAAPHGQTLGGGLELALGAQVRVAARELYCGLVELGVGLVPAGGGCLRLLQRMAQRKNRRGGALGAMQNALAAFDLIGYARVSSSAEDAQAKGLLFPEDRVVAARDALIQEAKQAALARLEGFQPLAAQPVLVPGEGGLLVLEDTVDGLLRAGTIPPHAGRVAKVLARVLCGGREANPTEPVPEQRILDLEREAFLELCGEPLSRARMAHMLKTGKPLFN